MTESPGLYCMFCGIAPTSRVVSLLAHLDECERCDLASEDAIEVVMKLAAKLGMGRHSSNIDTPRWLLATLAVQALAKAPSTARASTATLREGKHKYREVRSTRSSSGNQRSVRTARGHLRRAV